MARILLSDARDWALADKSQDLRGWEVRDARGTPIGEVGDLIVDTDAERVETIVLKDGATFRAADVRLADRVVYVDSYSAPAPAASPAAAAPPAGTPAVSATAERDEPLPSAAPPAAPETPVRSLADARTAARADAGAVGAYADFEDSFRADHRSRYSDGGLDYAEYAPAYRFGYDMGFDARYAGRDFDASEAELRADYYRRYGYPMSDNVVWHSLRDAVRHAYDAARRPR